MAEPADQPLPELARLRPGRGGHAERDLQPPKDHRGLKIPSYRVGRPCPEGLWDRRVAGDRREVGVRRCGLRERLALPAPARASIYF